ncbi:MAG: carboxymuconolactone decarboxylase family protein [Acidimicrobiia bacterium]|nr:carboxymuconolactone decarboxylase family protein [Acidimicrobiia bacterium]
MNEPTSIRLAPLDEDDWPAALDAARDGMARVLNVHRVMANHADLLAAWSPLRNHIAVSSSLSERFRELVILRVAFRAQVAYEWHHHVRRAMRAGISPSEIEAVQAGPGAMADPTEALLLAVTDELHDDLKVGDASWEALTAALSVAEVLDLIITVGMYTTLAMFINTTGVQIEDE